MKDKRFYNYLMVLYEDDACFKEQYKCLMAESDVIYIRHDKDIDEETGELKKPHYHFVLKLKNACTLSALSKRVGVAENLIEPIKKSFNGSLKYLIHFGYDNKYQYSVDEVKSNSPQLKRRFEDLVNKDTPEVEKVIALQDYIDSCMTRITMSQLSRYAQKINQWDAFRRNYSLFRDLVAEHNYGNRM